MDSYKDACDGIERFFGSPTEKFKNLHSNADKIRYCYQQAKKINLFMHKEKLAEKSEILAIKARNDGNDLFMKKKDFVGALEQYNKSLCLSPPGSENLGICYANRSAVYFQSGLFKLSLENIDLALNHNCPEKIVLKLEARREKCEQLQLKKAENEKKDQQVPVKLSYPANKQIPSIIADLELKQSEEFGRHICAKRNLYPGDIVMIDEPYIKILDDNATHKMCNNCHEPQLLNLFPCQFCTNTMYCSPKCEQEAWKRFHKYECGVLEDYTARLAFRATLTAFTLYDDLGDLKALLSSTSDKPITGFDLNCEEITESDTLKVTYNLATAYSKEDHSTAFFCSHVLAQTWHIFINSSKIAHLLQSRNNEDFFLETLFHFTFVAKVNSHELVCTSKANPEEDVEAAGLYDSHKYGSAIFPVISLLNHSCAPNVMRINNNSKKTIMVIRNIKTGEQLFDNYGPHHQKLSKASRQQELSGYFFKCQCEACVNNYPIYRHLKFKRLHEFLEFITDHRKAGDYDIQSALQDFPKYTQFLKRCGHHYPCVEILTVQSYLQSCSIVLFGDSPLEWKLKPFTKID